MSIRDVMSALLLFGAGYAVGKGVAKKQRPTPPDNANTFPQAYNVSAMIDMADVSLTLTPLQLLDAQFDTANQTLTDALVTARQKILDNPGNNNDLDPVPGKISAKQAALAIAVMGKIGQLAEVVGAVGQVTSGVQGMKDEADKMKAATKYINFGGGLLSATDSLIAVVNRPRPQLS